MLFAEQAPVDSLHVFDVEDKTNPTEIGTLDGGGTHTATCILDCAYSYGSYDLVGPEGASTGGTLVDLKDPSAPKDLGHWNEKLPADKIHDVIEVAPGSCAHRIRTLDVPRCAQGSAPSEAAREWNQSSRNANTPSRGRTRGRDRFIISSFETNGTPRCEAGTGAITVWDASKWRQHAHIHGDST